VNNLREGGNYIFHSFMEAAGFTVGRARAYTGAAANLAGQVRGGSRYGLRRLVKGYAVGWCVAVEHYCSCWAER
jgi:hypothetical protein